MQRATIFLILLYSAGGRSQQEDESSKVGPTPPPFFVGGSQSRNNTCTVLSNNCNACIRQPECAWCAEFEGERYQDLRLEDEDQSSPYGVGYTKVRCDLRSW